MSFPRKSLASVVLIGCLGGSGFSPAAGGETAAATAPTRSWTGTHAALAGPMIGPDWFSSRETIVYLLPQGADLSSVRQAAAQLMHEEWIVGKHDIKHIFVSDISGRVRFLAGRRKAVQEITEQVTIQSGGDLEYAADNLPFVRDQVFFIWDPNAEVWGELLGPSIDDEPRLRILLLDHDGQVARTIDPTALDSDPELGQLPEFVVEVRETFAAP